MNESEFIKLIDNNPERKNHPIALLKESKLPVIIWGAGSLAHSVKKYLDKCDVKISGCLVDNGIPHKKSFFGKIPIYNLQEIEQRFHKVNIVMGHSKYHMRYGLKNLSKVIQEVVLFCNICYEQYAPFSYSFIKENVNSYISVYTKFNDDTSRRCMVAYLNSRMNDNISYIEDVFCAGHFNSYFDNELFKISDKEIYLDCGAYTGDTCQQFINECNGNYDKIIAFEPEKKSFSLLKSSMDIFERIELYQLGCYNRRTELCFSDNEESSGIIEDGNDKISVVDIDSVIEDKVTMVKINYLYGVKETLYGARKLILKYTPKIAISVGFDALTLCEVVQFFEEINIELNELKYKMIIRFTEPMPSRLIFLANVKQLRG